MCIWQYNICVIWEQCRRKPEWAAKLQQLTSIFCHCPVISMGYGPLYVALSSLTLPLRPRIKSFATSKALSGPFQDPFTLVPPSGGGGSGEGLGGCLCRLCFRSMHQLCRLPTLTIQSLNKCWVVWVFTDSCSGSYMDDTWPDRRRQVLPHKEMITL